MEAESTLPISRKTKYTDALETKQQRNQDRRFDHAEGEDPEVNLICTSRHRGSEKRAAGACAVFSAVLPAVDADGSESRRCITALADATRTKHTLSSLRRKRVKQIKQKRDFSTTMRSARSTCVASTRSAFLKTHADNTLYASGWHSRATYVANTPNIHQELHLGIGLFFLTSKKKKKKDAARS